MAPEAQTPAQCPDGDNPQGWSLQPPRTKHFHGVSSGSQHPYFLKSRYGKAVQFRASDYVAWIDDDQQYRLVFCDSTSFLHNTFGLHCEAWAADRAPRQEYNVFVILDILGNQLRISPIAYYQDEKAGAPMVRWQIEKA